MYATANELKYRKIIKLLPEGVIKKGKMDVKMLVVIKQKAINHKYKNPSLTRAITLSNC